MAIVATAVPMRRGHASLRASALPALSSAAIACAAWLLLFANDDKFGVAIGTAFAVLAPLAVLRWLEMYWEAGAEYTRAGTAVIVVAALASLLVPYESGLVESQITTVVLGRGDPTLFARDLVMQAEHRFGSYSFFANLIALFPERILFVSLYVFWLWSWMAYGLMFFWLHKRHFRSENAVLGAAIVLVAMGLTNYWDRWGAVVLGDNDLLYPFMRHQTPALILGFGGLYACWRHRAVLAGFLIGLALNLHVNTGQHCLIVLALSWIIIDRRAIRPYAVAIVVAGIVALPTLWPLFHTLGRSAPGVHNPFIVVSGYFRHPNHLIPSSWSLALYLRYTLLLVAGLMAWWLKKDKNKIDRHLLLLLLSPIVFVLIGYVFVEIIPIDFFAKLQLSRMTLFSKIVAFLYLSRLIVQTAPRMETERWTYARWLPAAALSVFLLAALALNRHQVTAPAPNALENFFRTQTAKSSLVLLPLDWKLSQFAVRTERSVVADLKRLPLGTDADLVEYFQRVCAIEGTTPEFTPEMAQRMMADREKNYHALQPDQIENLRNTYHFDYMVRSAKYPLLPGKKPIFSGSGFRVYDFRASDPTS